MKVELLYTDSCPHYKEALHILQDILKEIGSDEPITMTMIRTEKDVKEHRFSGSPTIRINEKDVDPKFKDSGNYGFRCRVYFWEGNFNPFPPAGMIQETIRSFNETKEKKWKLLKNDL